MIRLGRRVTGRKNLAARSPRALIGSVKAKGTASELSRLRLIIYDRSRLKPGCGPTLLQSPFPFTCFALSLQSLPARRLIIEIRSPAQEGLERSLPAVCRKQHVPQHVRCIRHNFAGGVYAWQRVWSLKARWNSKSTVCSKACAPTGTVCLSSKIWHGGQHGRETTCGQVDLASVCQCGLVQKLLFCFRASFRLPFPDRSPDVNSALDWMSTTRAQGHRQCEF